VSKIIARVWFGLTALIGAAGVTLSAILHAESSPAEIVQVGGGLGAPGDFDNAFYRLTITFFYFTIWSNIIVIITTAMLMVRLERESTVFRVFRLYGLISILITGLVYNLYLVRLDPPHGIALLQNDMVHVAVPILAILGWLIFGPRIPFRMKYVWWSMVIGLTWLAVTFLHGAFITWYPYPFTNAAELGYPTALLNCLVVLVFAFLIGLGIMALDKVLPGSDGTDDPKLPGAPTATS